VSISREAPENKFFALFPDRIVSAYEVYWDGTYISSNGSVGNSPEEEAIGQYFTLVQIPNHLATTGKHTVALRISNWNVTSLWEKGQVFFGYYDSILKLVFAWQVRIYFLLGVVFLAMCLHIFLSFTSQRRLTHLLFGTFCLAIFFSLLFNYYWTIANVSNSYLDYRNLIVPMTLVLIGTALPVFFLFEFDVPCKTWVTVAIMLLNGYTLHAASDGESLNTLVFYLLTVNVLLLALWGASRKREGTIPVLMGISASVLINRADLRFGIDNVTMFSTVIIICYTYILAAQFSRNEREKQEAMVRSIRLENLLLKRCINPHYLLNSLTAIIAWLRRDPPVAIQLVESLSKEFRIVSQISNLQKIAVRTEIELCETHLRIMSCRRKATFALEHRNLDLEEEIPPMIFHTLVENGVTHSFEDRSEGRFMIERTEMPDGVRYSVFNDGQSGDESTAHGTGTGFKYIKARLEESYPGRWTFEYGEVENGYAAHIALFHHAKKNR
jgi:hypothetical protein